MVKNERIPTARGDIEAIWVSLQSKNLIVLTGSKGYVMCGYLDLAAAEKFGDAAVRVTGVSTIQDTLNSSVQSCTTQARELGIKEGQPIIEVLALIA